jgi:hypothetical protein
MCYCISPFYLAVSPRCVLLPAPAVAGSFRIAESKAPRALPLSDGAAPRGAQNSVQRTDKDVRTNMTDWSALH